MTLPASGSISLTQVAAELGVGAAIGLGDANVRNLAQVPTGAISLTDLYGKTRISLNSQQYGLTTSFGFSSSGLLYGSISPTNFNGYTILGLNANDTGLIVSIATNVAANIFSAVRVNGATFTSASAVFTQNGSSPFNTTWVWASGAGLLGVGTYDVSFAA
jgi:hypothetical protein